MNLYVTKEEVSSKLIKESILLLGHLPVYFNLCVLKRVVQDKKKGKCLSIKTELTFFLAG